MRTTKTSVLSFLAFLLLTGSLAMHTWRSRPTSPPVAEDMQRAALAFLETVPTDQKQQVLYPFDSDERTFWHFVPMTGQRKGLPVKEMSIEQRKALHELLKSALSVRGYLKATAIQHLEQVLGDIENNPAYRDPTLYYLTLFGEPSEETPWGWRYEGHHLSLNFSVVGSELTVTPAFMGANPAEVREGAFAGWEVLHDEIEIALRLVASMTEAQRNRVRIAKTAPRDIITGNQREATLDAFEGLPFSEMTEAQQDLLILLISVYASNLEDEEAEKQLKRIQDAGIDRLYFSWAGSFSPDEGHYYRIHGPKTLIEYDNTQNRANHIHTVWRDFENDFGRDVLRLHYENSDETHGH